MIGGGIVALIGRSDSVRQYVRKPRSSHHEAIMEQADAGASKSK
jgi:hypothetical protein